MNSAFGDERFYRHLYEKLISPNSWLKHEHLEHNELRSIAPPETIVRVEEPEGEPACILCLACVGAGPRPDYWLVILARVKLHVGRQPKRPV